MTEELQMGHPDRDGEPTGDPGPVVIVLFGATGDLARRLVLPGFYRLALPLGVSHLRLLGHTSCPFLNDRGQLLAAGSGRRRAESGCGVDGGQVLCTCSPCKAPTSRSGSAPPRLASSSVTCSTPPERDTSYRRW